MRSFSRLHKNIHFRYTREIETFYIHITLEPKKPAKHIHLLLTNARNIGKQNKTAYNAPD